MILLFYHVVENPAAIYCFDCEWVDLCALLSPRDVRKYRLGDSTAYGALQLGIRAGPTVETFTGRSRG